MNNVLTGLLAFLGGLVGGLAGKTIYISISKSRDRRWEKRFLRYARVVFPEAKVIDLITVGPGRKQTIEDIERQLRDASKTLQQAGGWSELDDVSDGRGGNGHG